MVFERTSMNQPTSCSIESTMAKQLCEIEAMQSMAFHRPQNLMQSLIKHAKSCGTFNWPHKCIHISNNHSTHFPYFSRFRIEKIVSAIFFSNSIQKIRNIISNIERIIWEEEELIGFDYCCSMKYGEHHDQNVMCIKYNNQIN